DTRSLENKVQWSGKSIRFTELLRQLGQVPMESTKGPQYRLGPGNYPVQPDPGPISKNRSLVPTKESGNGNPKENQGKQRIRGVLLQGPGYPVKDHEVTRSEKTRSSGRIFMESARVSVQGTVQTVY